MTAFSSDAPDDVDVAPLGFETRIRIGDPDLTITGQHRYELGYTLPEAQVAPGSWPSTSSRRARSWRPSASRSSSTGSAWTTPCATWARWAPTGGCDLREVADGTYRAEIEPLEAGDGITIGGTIVEVVEPIDVAAPALPERITEDSRLPLAVSMIPLGLASGGAVYLWSAGAAATRCSPAAPPTPPTARRPRRRRPHG